MFRKEIIMKNIIIRTLASTLCLLFLMSFLAVKDAYPFEAGDDSQPDKLLVLWTSGDREVAIKMVYMYTYNAKKNGWWGKIRFIIWGPSSKLLSEDEELQQETKKMMEEGIEVFACKACADLYGVSEKIEKMGITVKFVGEDLTSMLKSDWVTITF